MRPHLLLPGGDFEPTDFADCKLWLRADAGNFTKDDSNLVPPWNDLSGQGNQALNVTADATKAAFTVDDIAAGAHGVVFDGTNDSLTIANDASLVLGTGDFTACMVAKFATPGDHGYMYTHTADGVNPDAGGARGIGFRHLHSAHRIRVTFRPTGTADTITSATLASPGVFAFVLRIDRDGFMRFYTNGTPSTPVDISSDAAVAFTAPTAGVWLGTDVNGDVDFAGSVGECLLYKRLLTLAETNRLGVYFAARYGISWTDITA